MARGTTAGNPAAGTAWTDGQISRAPDTTGDDTPGSSILTCNALVSIDVPIYRAAIIVSSLQGGASIAGDARLGLFSRFFQDRFVQDLDETLCGAQNVFSRACSRAIQCKARLLNGHVADRAHHADEPLTLSIRHCHCRIPLCSLMLLECDSYRAHIVDGLHQNCSASSHAQANLQRYRRMTKQHSLTTASENDGVAR